MKARVGNPELLWLLALLFVVAMSGCSILESRPSLEAHAAQCYAAQGSPSFTQAGSTTSFTCVRK